MECLTENNAVPPSDVPSGLWDELKGRVWHATSLANAQNILRSGGLSGTLQGSHYPTAFVRSFGAVSVFDFRVVNAVEALDPSLWTGWLGKEKRAPYAVWFHICSKSERLVSGSVLYERWIQEKTELKIIPYIEGAYLGGIKLSQVLGALIICSNDVSCYEYFEFKKLKALIPNFLTGESFVARP